MFVHTRLENLPNAIPGLPTFGRLMAILFAPLPCMMVEAGSALPYLRGYPLKIDHLFLSRNLKIRMRLLNFFGLFFLSPIPLPPIRALLTPAGSPLFHLPSDDTGAFPPGIPIHSDPLVLASPFRFCPLRSENLNAQVSFLPPCSPTLKLTPNNSIFPRLLIE